MNGVYILAATVWLAVIVYAAPSVWQMMAGRPLRCGDPMRLACFITGVVFVAGSLRWLLAPTSMTALAGIFVLVIIDGLYILSLMRAYGRGDVV